MKTFLYLVGGIIVLAVLVNSVTGEDTPAIKKQNLTNIPTETPASEVPTAESTPTPLPTPTPTATVLAKPSAAAKPTTPLAQCDPNYSGCVPVDTDVDCAGGSGNGPSYVRGPIRVLGVDIYDLDRDNDGIACE